MYEYARLLIRLQYLESMRLFCAVFELYGVIYRKSSIFTYPTFIWHPRWG